MYVTISYIYIDVSYFLLGFQIFQNTKPHILRVIYLRMELSNISLL